MVVLLARSKTHRNGLPVEMAVRRYAGLNAYDLLCHWLQVRDITSTPDAFIFPTHTHLCHLKSIDWPWWNKKFKLLFTFVLWNKKLKLLLLVMT